MESDANKKPAKPNPVLLIIVIAVLGMFAYGFVRTLFNNFYDSIHSNHENAQDAALVFFSVIYIIGRVGVNWKRNKDDIAHPFYTRVFHIIELLLFAVLVLTVIWLVLKYSGFLRI